MKIFEHKTMRAVAGLAALVLVGAGYAAIYKQTQTIPAAKRAELAQEQRKILFLESEIKRKALEGRYGRVNHYDGLVQAAQDLEHTVEDWSGGMARLVGPEHAQMAEHAEVLAALTESQSAGLEKFKSHNSVLKNSLRYLPMAIQGLERMGEGRPELHGLEVLAREVLLETYMFSSFRGEDNQRALHAALDALKQEQTRLEASDAAQDESPDMAKARREVLSQARLVWLHGDICHRELRAVESLLSELDVRPLHRAVLGAEKTFTAHLVAMERRAGVFRTLLYGLSVVLGLLLLASGFWLRRLYATLEQKVELRTRELSRAHERVSALYDSNHLVLQNVLDGLLTITLDGAMSPEISSAMLRWFGEPPAESSLMGWLAPIDPLFSETLELALEDLRDGFMPAEVVLAQMPSKLCSDERVYRVTYRPIGEQEVPESLLVIMEDITDLLAHERETAWRAQVVTMSQHLFKRRRSAIEFIEETNRLLGELGRMSDLKLIKRHVHTMKGNAGIFGCEDFAARCHRFEDQLQESCTLPTPIEIEALSSVWSDFVDDLSPFLVDCGGMGGSREAEDVAELRAALVAGVPRQVLLGMIDSWSMESLEARFESMAGTIEEMASSRGLEAPLVEIECEDLRMDGERWRGFWASTVHVVGNMLDHGIESPLERDAMGKEPRGRIQFSGRLVEDQLVLRFADDGRGVDWQRVVQLASERGVTIDARDLGSVLFSDGFSTQENVTRTSGRGVGLSAVREACADLGGRVVVKSHMGQGTEMIFVFPRDLVRSATPTIGPKSKLALY